MGLNGYDSGMSSMNSSSSWGSQELDWQTFQAQLLSQARPEPMRRKAASYADLANGRCTIEDVMKEFRMNGSDAPYSPDDEPWTRANVMPLPSYVRQTSWPAPERSPHQRLPRPVSACYPAAQTMPNAEVQLPTVLSEEQRRVLSSLPDAAVLTLLRDMQRHNKRQLDTECRFCKNNGERESYYRSHCLKDVTGRVECPVLRAFVCKRCGAMGDNAHTIKYCPLSTSEERMKSAAMMRSVRLASGRRRELGAQAQDSAWPARREVAPLDPLWAALEQKLML